MKFIEILENTLEKKAKKKFLPIQPGDVQDTFADVSDLSVNFGYKPSTNIQQGIKNFVKWYKEYYKV